MYIVKLGRDSMDKGRTIQNDDEIEIDLGAFFLRLKSCWRAILVGLLTGALVGLLYAMFLVTPMYSSSSMVYLRSTNSTSLSLQDLQVGTQLTKDYEIIFKSRPVLEKTISDLNLKMNTDTLGNMITITNPEDSRILQISVTADNPNLAKSIVNSVMDNGINTVSEIDSQEPYVIEKGIADTKKVSVSAKKTCMIGAGVGAILVIAYVFAQFMLRDTISSADDVERYLGVPVLAVVGEDPALNQKKDKRKSKKKRGASK